MKGYLFPVEIKKEKKREEKKRKGDRRVIRKRKKKFLHLVHHAENVLYKSLISHSYFL